MNHLFVLYIFLTHSFYIFFKLITFYRQKLFKEQFLFELFIKAVLNIFKK